MHYMQRNADKRSDPRLLYPRAQSVISVLLSYKPSQTIQGPHKIARYAYSDDYHHVIKHMLFQMITLIKDRYPSFNARPFVDTAPISDKHWAAAAGLGWIGRNTLLISPAYGSFCNLGELLSDSPVDAYDTPLDNHCGTCSLCVRSCPNQALQLVQGRYMLNAAKCTAYNTIENRHHSLPHSQRLAGYVFGCDICQEVCPHNAHTPPAVHLSDQKISSLRQLPSADQSTFDSATRHTPLSRISYSQWVRNLSAVSSKPSDPSAPSDPSDPLAHKTY